MPVLSQTASLLPASSPLKGKGLISSLAFSQEEREQWGEGVFPVPRPNVSSPPQVTAQCPQSGQWHFYGKKDKYHFYQASFTQMDEDGGSPLVWVGQVVCGGGVEATCHAKRAGRGGPLNAQEECHACPGERKSLPAL